MYLVVYNGNKQYLMNQETFWVLFSKKLSGEASKSELAELQDIVHKNPEWQYAIQIIEDLWKNQPPEDYMQAEDAFMLHKHRMNEKISTNEDFPVDIPVHSISKRLRWYWVAAAFVIIATTFFLIRKSSMKGEEKGLLVHQLNVVTTQPGSKTKIQLPDGSVVWLNAGSKLTYSKDFGKDLREVNLTGEAFFDVTKIKEKPFIIHTTSINIKVLGTSFNVKAYPEDKQTETSLIRGSIEVTITNRPNDKIILSPSEKLVVENNLVVQREKVAVMNNTSALQQPAVAPLVLINKLKYNVEDSTIDETQWVNNKLIFRDESFADVAVRMERWYNVSIDIKEPELRKERLNGHFQNETILQALEALKESIPFHFEQNGNKIFINH